MARATVATTRAMRIFSRRAETPTVSWASRRDCTNCAINRERVRHDHQKNAISAGIAITERSSKDVCSKRIRDLWQFPPYRVGQQHLNQEQQHAGGNHPRITFLDVHVGLHFG